MARNASPEEIRNTKIAELTEQLFQARLAKLGQPAVLRDVAHSVFDYLVFSDDQYKLAAGEITFIEVRDSVMRDEAEVDAIKEVERLERNRAESRGDNRIHMAVADRVAV